MVKEMHKAKEQITNQAQAESGSIFTMLLGGLALAGILGLLTFNMLSGPVLTVAEVKNDVLAKNQMMAIGKINIMQTGHGANHGDCDGDGYAEPLAWRNGTTIPGNGGLIPLDMGAPVTDAWGRDIGYCVWDTGPVTDSASCGGAGANRLDGADQAVTGDADLQYVMAFISAGANGTFSTTCKDYATATTDGTGMIVSSGDDIVKTFTYVEAASISRSLWQIKSSDEDVATIDKQLEINNAATDFTAVTTLGKIVAGGGIKYGTETDITTCDIFHVGVLRQNTILPGTEVCTDQGGGVYTWQQVTGTATDLWTDNTSYISRENFHIIKSGETMPTAIGPTAGRRLVWYPDKAAFRAGYVSNGTDWSESHIGDYSVGFGYNPDATGTGSFVSGIDLTASGNYSTAFGSSGAIGSGGYGAFRANWFNHANGRASIALGVYARANNDHSIAIGHDIRASADDSLAFSLEDHPTSYYEVTASNIASWMGGNVGVDRLSPVATMDINGGLMVGKQIFVCSAVNNGVLRYDETKLEFCAGSNVQDIITIPPIASFTISPSNVTDMDVTGSGNPAYSGYTTFTLTNIGSATSGVIETSLADTTYFEFGTNNCDDVTLAGGTSCTIDVRAKARTSTPYSTTLDIEAAQVNNVSANLAGTSAATCPVGNAQDGGLVAACYEDYYLIVTPANCTDSATPTCDATTDALTKVTHSGGAPPFDSVNSLTDGPSNTTSLIGASANYDATQYCADMNYGGYTDWYLPAHDEVADIYNASGTLGGFASGTYLSSSQNGSNNRSVDFATGTTGQYSNYFNPYYLRCARRNNNTAPAASEDAGYMVLSADLHDGDFGGLTGMDSWCLTQLTNNNWKGKSNAQDLGYIDAAHVKALNCSTGATCNNLTASKKYYFAVAGNILYGGASFTSAATNNGPNDTAPWRQNQYFGPTFQEYWHNRNSSTPADELWDTAGEADSAVIGSGTTACAQWNDNSASSTGYVGQISSFGNRDRWGGNNKLFNRVACNETRRVICLVNPDP